MVRKLCIALAAALACAAAQAEDAGKRLNPVPGEKLDSGIGELPRASRTAGPRPAPARDGKPARINVVVGEKLDSGLGEAVARR